MAHTYPHLPDHPSMPIPPIGLLLGLTAALAVIGIVLMIVGMVT